jgi:alpha-tubulin suppressor-like RCC1 family protein
MLASCSCNLHQPRERGVSCFSDSCSVTHIPCCLVFVSVVSGACGHSHSLVYTTIGELYAMGADRAGQCGQGRRNNGGVRSPTQISTIGTVVDVSCGKEFSVAATAAGKLYSWGSPENGQLGNGTDGKYYC